MYTDDLDILLPEEKEKLDSLLVEYNEARTKKNYELSDKLHTEILRWDSSGGILNGKKWHPFFDETSLERMYFRAKKYLILFYPYDSDRNGNKLSIAEHIELLRIVLFENPKVYYWEIVEMAKRHTRGDGWKYGS